MAALEGKADASEEHPHLSTQTMDAENIEHEEAYLSAQTTDAEVIEGEQSYLSAPAVQKSIFFHFSEFKKYSEINLFSTTLQK